MTAAPRTQSLWLIWLGILPLKKDSVCLRTSAPQSCWCDIPAPGPGKGHSWAGVTAPGHGLGQPLCPEPPWSLPPAAWWGWPRGFAARYGHPVGLSKSPFQRDSTSSATAAGETSVLKLFCCTCPRVGIVASKCPGSPDHVRHLAFPEPSGLEEKSWVHMAVTESISRETAILEAGTPFQEEQINTSPAVFACPRFCCPGLGFSTLASPGRNGCSLPFPIQGSLTPVSLWERLS